MIDVKFQCNGGAIFSTGSNTNITVSRNVLMENAEGSCSIELPQNCNLISSQEVRCGSMALIPTTNGVAFKCALKANEKATFTIEVGQPFLNVRANDKCFALMKERFYFALIWRKNACKIYVYIVLYFQEGFRTTLL